MPVPGNQIPSLIAAARELVEAFHSKGPAKSELTQWRGRSLGHPATSSLRKLPQTRVFHFGGELRLDRSVLRRLHGADRQLRGFRKARDQSLVDLVVVHGTPGGWDLVRRLAQPHEIRGAPCAAE